jgi:hypothetical protein
MKRNKRYNKIFDCALEKFSRGPFIIYREGGMVGLGEGREGGSSKKKRAPKTI